ncbi:MAG: hypothetical protein AMJ46_03930 [Latescibacteria bacterium DG_63]|nr:MAG: hypothetical protein AMJ46_03930 [Latescibacteria bacterium DG_63]
MVMYLRVGFSVSARRACEVLRQHRSTHYYKGRRDPQTALRMRLRDLAESRVSYGYRRLHVLLKRDGWSVNAKGVYRLYVQEGLVLRRKKPRRRRSVAHRVALPEPVGCNEVWSMDFVSDELSWGHRFRALTIVDHFSRESLAIEVGVSMGGKDVVAVLERLARTRGLPGVIQVDNGAEFTSKALDQWAYENGVKLEFIRPGKPVENAYIESFNASLRKECLNVHWFWTLEEARARIEQWRKEYNEVRPHSSLGNLTPREFVENREPARTSETRFLTLQVV